MGKFSISIRCPGTWYQQQYRHEPDECFCEHLMRMCKWSPARRRLLSIYQLSQVDSGIRISCHPLDGQQICFLRSTELLLFPGNTLRRGNCSECEMWHLMFHIHGQAAFWRDGSHSCLLGILFMGRMGFIKVLWMMQYFLYIYVFTYI